MQSNLFRVLLKASSEQLSHRFGAYNYVYKQKKLILNDINKLSRPSWRQENGDVYCICKR